VRAAGAVLALPFIVTALVLIVVFEWLDRQVEWWGTTLARRAR
jgi:uncharacterized membrane protein